MTEKVDTIPTNLENQTFTTTATPALTQKQNTGLNMEENSTRFEQQKLPKNPVTSYPSQAATNPAAAATINNTREPVNAEGYGQSNRTESAMQTSTTTKPAPGETTTIAPPVATTTRLETTTATITTETTATTIKSETTTNKAPYKSTTSSDTNVVPTDEIASTGKQNEEDDQASKSPSTPNWTTTTTNASAQTSGETTAIRYPTTTPLTTLSTTTAPSTTLSTNVETTSKYPEATTTGEENATTQQQSSVSTQQAQNFTQYTSEGTTTTNSLPTTSQGFETTTKARPETETTTTSEWTNSTAPSTTETPSKSTSANQNETTTSSLTATTQALSSKEEPTTTAPKPTAQTNTGSGVKVFTSEKSANSIETTTAEVYAESMTTTATPYLSSTRQVGNGQHTTTQKGEQNYQESWKQNTGPNSQSQDSPLSPTNPPGVSVQEPNATTVYPLNEQSHGTTGEINKQVYDSQQQITTNSIATPRPYEETTTANQPVYDQASNIQPQQNPVMTQNNQETPYEKYIRQFYAYYQSKSMSSATFQYKSNAGQQGQAQPVPQQKPENQTTVSPGLQTTTTTTTTVSAVNQNQASYPPQSYQPQDNSSQYLEGKEVDEIVYKPYEAPATEQTQQQQTPENQTTASPGLQTMTTTVSPVNQNQASYSSSSYQPQDNSSQYLEGKEVDEIVYKPYEAPTTEQTQQQQTQENQTTASPGLQTMTTTLSPVNQNQASYSSSSYQPQDNSSQYLEGKEVDEIVYKPYEAPTTEQTQQQQTQENQTTASPGLQTMTTTLSPVNQNQASYSSSSYQPQDNSSQYLEGKEVDEIVYKPYEAPTTEQTQQQQTQENQTTASPGLQTMTTTVSPVNQNQAVYSAPSYQPQDNSSQYLEGKEVDEIVYKPYEATTTAGQPQQPKPQEKLSSQPSNYKTINIVTSPVTENMAGTSSPAYQSQDNSTQYLNGKETDEIAYKPYETGVSVQPQQQQNQGNKTPQSSNYHTTTAAAASTVNQNQAAFTTAPYQSQDNSSQYLEGKEMDEGLFADYHSEQEAKEDQTNNVAQKGSEDTVTEESNIGQPSGASEGNALGGPTGGTGPSQAVLTGTADRVNKQNGMLPGNNQSESGQPTPPPYYQSDTTTMAGNQFQTTAAMPTRQPELAILTATTTTTEKPNYQSYNYMEGKDEKEVLYQTTTTAPPTHNEEVTG